MRRFSAAVFGAAIVAASLGVSLAADSDTYALGTPIDVILTQGVTTETAHPGDTFYFKTVDDVKLGTLDVPAGSPGTGRLSVAIPATSKTPGSMSLQADSISVGTATVWVNIDPSVQPHGHYATNRDLALDPGMKFRVITIAPRKKPADLVTPPPADQPTTVSPGGPAPSSSPSPAS